MSECQALHPDPDDSDSDFDGDEYDVEEAGKALSSELRDAPLSATMKHSLNLSDPALTLFTDWPVEQGQIDLPTYYSFEEGMSQLTVEGQATLERLEGMLAQSTAPQHCMAGVRTEDTAAAVDGKERSVRVY